MALSNKLKDKLKSSSYGGLISNDQPTLVGEVSIRILRGLIRKHQTKWCS
jgi:hypothetical protein